MVLALAALAACARPGSSPGTPGGPADPAAAFEKRAAEVARAWMAGPAAQWRDGFVPLEPLTVGPDGFTESTKIAFGAGWYRTRIDLPSTRPADGTIAFPDGTKLGVPLVSASAAYAAIDLADPPCPPGGKATTEPSVPPPADQPSAGPDTPVSSGPIGECAWLTVTGVKLGTTTVQTSRGEARVPAWLFTVAELSKPIARVAVDPSVTKAPPTFEPAPSGYTAGLVAAQDLQAIDGAKVTYRLGVGACDTSIQPLVYETDGVVIVGGSVVHSTGACTDQLLLHPVTVTLQAPVGERAVLDALTGQPLRAFPL